MTALLERVRFIGGNGGETGPVDVDTMPAGGDGAELLDPDPEPGRQTRKRAKSETSKATAGRQTRTGGKFTSRAAVQRGIADELEMYARMLALTWSMSDPECAGVLNESSANIARDMAALLARSDWVVERFATTSMLADCIKLMHSLFPLVRAVYTHHAAGRGEQQTTGEEYTSVSVGTDDVDTYAPWRPSVVGN